MPEKFNEIIIFNHDVPDGEKGDLSCQHYW